MTLNGASPTDYRGRFPARLPIASRISHPDEIKELGHEAGVCKLVVAPAEAADLGHPPIRDRGENTNKHIWLVAPLDVRYALEVSETLPYIGHRGRCLTHTNLSGGAKAHCGGELWFLDKASIVINGGSGRYPPRGEDELDAAAHLFLEYGYKTAHMGWEQEVNRPCRYLRGEPQWL